MLHNSEQQKFCGKSNGLVNKKTTTISTSSFLHVYIAWFLAIEYKQWLIYKDQIILESQFQYMTTGLS